MEAWWLETGYYLVGTILASVSVSAFVWFRWCEAVPLETVPPCEVDLRAASDRLPYRSPHADASGRPDAADRFDD